MALLIFHRGDMIAGRYQVVARSHTKCLWIGYLAFDVQSNAQGEQGKAVTPDVHIKVIHPQLLNA